MPTNDDLNQHNNHGEPVDAEHPGYETTDVNVNGVAVVLTSSEGEACLHASRHALRVERNDRHRT